MIRWLVVPLAILSAPGWAQWEFARWGMTATDLVAASGGLASAVPDEDGKRIRDMHRLATGKTTLDGIDYTVDYFFDDKARKLVAVNFTPEKTQCDAAQAAYVARFGKPKEKRTELKLSPRQPPLITIEYEWRDRANGNDMISGTDVSAQEMRIRYCQFLRSE